jgi:CDP-6-deoxy-D-xylo-4-hexulose-3-dehydrase
VRNLDLFLNSLDSKKFRTDFDREGAVNYAFTLVLNQPDDGFRDRVMATLKEAGVEFRRGTSGGGNQLRQPYLRKLMPEGEFSRYPETDHVHFYGFYIGNYPELPEEKIVGLCKLLNSIE